MASGDMDKPYFERGDTIDQIERIARQQRIVIYAGSGVSIDKTGMSWSALIDELMKKRVEVNVHHAIKAGSPLESASIVKQMYEKAFGTYANGQIVNQLRTILYPSQLWRQAELPHAVMRLVAELDDHGIDYHVVTTNYDDFLEQQKVVLDADRQVNGKDSLALDTEALDYELDVSEMSALKKAVEKFAKCDWDSGESDRDQLRRLLVHLHGYVPEDPTTSASNVTLSEVDYAKSYRLSAAVLEDLLRNHSILILGSSLTDPPLLNALAQTKNEATGKRLARVAVMPMQGFDISAADSTLLGEVQRNIVDRMRHFGVSVTFPDFYSQTTQFVTEVRIAVGELQQGRRYKDSPLLYGTRLRSWWESWNGPRQSNRETANQLCHTRLREHLRGLQDQFDLNGERMKLEIWIRWDPKSSSRNFKLWASSTGTWTNEATMHTAEIGGRSKCQPAAIATFHQGRPDIHREENNRWRAHLCVPVRVNVKEGHDLPVAIMSLASMSTNTILKREEAANISDLTEVLAAIGAELATM